MTDCAMSDSRRIRCRNKVDPEKHPDQLCDRCRELLRIEEELGP